MTVGHSTRSMQDFMELLEAHAIKHLVDVPKQLVTNVVFDQSRFVKTAIRTLIDEGALGLFLTTLMILMFLRSWRSTLMALAAVSFGGSRKAK